MTKLDERALLGGDPVDTYAERTSLIDYLVQADIQSGEYECHAHGLRDAQPTTCAACLSRKHWRDHVARLRVLYSPLPAVRKIGTGAGMIWGGTIVGDTFYGDASGRFFDEDKRKHNAASSAQMAGTERYWSRALLEAQA